MSRSIWKLPFSEISCPLDGQTSERGWRTLNRQSSNPSQLSHHEREQQKTKIWSRRSTVLPQFIGKSFLVYNGKMFIPVKVSEEMTGHKFGEFATTRKKPIHKLSKKKQSRKK